MLLAKRHLVYGILLGLIMVLLTAACSKQGGPAGATGETGSDGSAGHPAIQSDEGQNAQEIVLLSPKAPVLIPALLAARQEEGNLRLKVATWDTLEQLVAAIQSKDAPFIAAPLNVGANIASKGLPLQLLHVNTWGSMYLVSASADVRSLSDLADATVYIPGQSGPPDVITRYLLREEGLEGKVRLAYSSVPELMQRLAAGSISHAVLPEPALSGLRVQMKGRLHEVVDYQRAWQDKFGENLPQAGIFVNSQWAEANREAVEQFQAMYRDALQVAVEKPGEALSVAADAFGIPEAVVAEAMPNMTLAFKEAKEAKPEVERYFNILLDSAPDSIGGRLPDASFYYGL